MKKKLSPEQTQKVRKLFTQYIWRFLGLTALYLGALILGNAAIILLNLYYMHNDEFQRAASFGTTIIIVIGLRIEQDKAYSKMKSEIAKIAKEAVNEK